MKPLTICSGLLRAVNFGPVEHVLVEKLLQRWSHYRKTSIDNSQGWLEYAPVCPFRGAISQVGQVEI